MAGAWIERVSQIHAYLTRDIVADNALISCSVDAEWIATKKDWEQNERKHKERSSLNEPRKDSMSSEGSHNDTGDGLSTTYDESMDEMRCILYAHGGKSFIE